MVGGWMGRVRLGANGRTYSGRNEGMEGES